MPLSSHSASCRRDLSRIYFCLLGLTFTLCHLSVAAPASSSSFVCSGPFPSRSTQPPPPPHQVLEYYRKAEDNAEHGASQYHGVGGPMPNTYVPYVNELSEAFLAACGQMGYRRNLDFNDWSAPQDGFGRYKVTQRNGERCSAWNAYIQGTDAKRRSNLVIATGAHVTQLQIDGSGDKLCAGGVGTATPR